ncbi:MAG TPA: hypothetical protein VEB68_00700 [Croceibacterium sp.]|nr:hypothetical protein [Croceibacterium sp.]
MSKRGGVVCFGLVVALAVATSATAQQTPGGTPPGPVGGPDVVAPDVTARGNETFTREFENRRLRADNMGAAGVRGGADAIATCILRRGGEKAADYLGGPLAGDPSYARISAALTGRWRTCTNNVAAATASNISDALAEQLLKNQAPTLADRAPAVDEDAAHAFYGDLAGPITFDNVAGCLAVYSPGLAYKVVQTEVGSDEEKAQLQAIYQQTPECGLQSMPAAIPQLYQRGALATALYKWTHRDS